MRPVLVRDEITLREGWCNGYQKIL
ncbi:uncharacterized protein METZ01_LOCUS462407, partial [marine metagenome]